MTGPAGRLVLVRHAQGCLGTGDYDRLSELGGEQARRLAARLRAELPERWQTFAGALKRHRQTWEAIDPPAPPVITPDLNEYRVDGLLEAAMEHAERLGIEPLPARAFEDPVGYLDRFMHWFPEVLSAWQSGSLDCRINGRWEVFRARVETAAARWRQDLARGETVLVVSSAGVISTLLAGLLERDLSWQRKINVGLYNASVSEFRANGDGRWEAVCINCTAHLDGPGMTTLA